MYRPINRAIAFSVIRANVRTLSTLVNDPLTNNSYADVARLLVDDIERDRYESELKVDRRKVIFAAASSADNRPRIAAAEAFDIAAAALPRAPNLCYVNVSVDCETMVDAPQVVWTELCKVNNKNNTNNNKNTNITNSNCEAASLPSVHMFGGVVSRQRLGRGYVQVLLGCVPDLQVDAFTFDTVPEMEEIHDPTRPPPVLCITALDSRLSLQYENVLSSRLSQLSTRLGSHCPLIGGIYPPIATKSISENICSDDANKERVKPDADTNNASCTHEPPSSTSVFFVNNRIYRGSAAAVLLRSRLLQAHSISLVPSIAVGDAIMDKITLFDPNAHNKTKVNKDEAKLDLTNLDVISADQTYINRDKVNNTNIFDSNQTILIHKLNGRPATHVIRELYESDDLRGRPSKIFLGFSHNNARVPISFTGNPETGTLKCTLPCNVQCRQGDQVYFLVDDVELDSETAAGLLISLEEKIKPISVIKDITVAKEGKRHVTTSSTAAFHFSYSGLNTRAQSDLSTIALDRYETLFMPTLLQRCNGKMCANGGIFCPGQVATIDNVTSIFARSHTYTFLQGIE